MTDESGVLRCALTNPFGYYRFTDVPVGMTYVFQVKAKTKRLEFAPQLVTVGGDVTELNFTGQ